MTAPGPSSLGADPAPDQARPSCPEPRPKRFGPSRHRDATQQDKEPRKDTELRSLSVMARSVQRVLPAQTSQMTPTWECPAAFRHVRIPQPTRGAWLRRCSPGRCWRCADILFGAPTRIEAGRLGAWRSERPTYQGDRGSADRQRIGQRPSNRSPICVTLGRGSRRLRGHGVEAESQSDPLPIGHRRNPHCLWMLAQTAGIGVLPVGSCSPHQDLRLQSDELSKCRPPVRTVLVRSSLERLVPAPYWNVASGGRIFLALAVRGPTRHQPRADRRSSDRPPVDRRPPRRSTFSLNGRPLPLSSRVDWVGSTRCATSSSVPSPRAK